MIPNFSLISPETLHVHTRTLIRPSNLNCFSPATGSRVRRGLGIVSTLLAVLIAPGACDLAYADVTVRFSDTVAKNSGLESAEDLQKVINAGLKKMADKGHQGAKDLLNSNQTIKIICYTEEEAKRFPEFAGGGSGELGDPARTVGDFDEAGKPTSRGTTTIAVDCNVLNAQGWFGREIKTVYGGKSQGLWEPLVHELLHATHRDRKHPPDDTSLYEQWVVDFNQAIAPNLVQLTETVQRRQALKAEIEGIQQRLAKAAPESDRQKRLQQQLEDKRRELNQIEPQSTSTPPASSVPQPGHEQKGGPARTVGEKDICPLPLEDAVPPGKTGMLRMDFRFGGGMTQIDPPQTNPQTKTFSGNFVKFPEGVVPRHVDVMDASGRTIRLTVEPDGNFQGQLPNDFVPVKQTLHVTGIDGKPYIANYELIDGQFRPAGKFQPAPAEAKAGTSGSSGQSTTGAMAPSTGVGTKFTASVSGSIDYRPTILSQPLDGCVSFAFGGKWEKPDKWLLNSEYEWDAFDSRSPSLELVHQDSTYTHNVQLRWDDLRYIQDRYEMIDVYGIRSRAGDRSYFGTQHYVIPQFPLLFNPSPTNDRYPFPLGEVRATAQHSMLGQFKRNANAWRVGKDLEDAGFPGWDSWTTWTNPSESNIFRYDVYSITDSVRFDRFNLMLSPHVNYIERNEPRNVAPAPGLSPRDWPRVHATALPHWSITVERSSR